MRNKEEYIEQCAFVEWLTLKGIKHTSIPNSTPSGRYVGKKWVPNFKSLAEVKNSGMNRGLPDIFIIVPCGDGKKRGVFIEMKKPSLKPKLFGKGGVKEEQREWIDAINECEEMAGYVAYGCYDATWIIESLMRTQ